MPALAPSPRPGASRRLPHTDRASDKATTDQAPRTKDQSAQEYVDGGNDDADISGVEANDDTGEITIHLLKPDGTPGRSLWLAHKPEDNPELDTLA